MLKKLALTFVLMPAAAQAFSTCDLTDIGGPGAEIVEEGSNPVVSGQWAYAGFTQDHKVMVLVASNNGATQQPLQTIFDKETGKAVNLRLAAAGKYLYAVWHFGPRGTTQLMFAANNNHGNKNAWSKPVALDVAHRALPQISADGNSVHIAYISPKNDTMVISSADGGQTFGSPVDLGASDAEVVIASRGADVYVAWETGKTSPLPGVDFGYSHDGGKTFSVSNISNNGVRHAHEPIMSLNQKSGRLSMVWREDTPTQGSYLQSNDDGVTWSTPIVIDQSSRQFMVQDNGPAIFISYLKEYTVNANPDWQVQLAVSKDNGATFPLIQNLSGPTGVSKIVGDNARPMPWSTSAQIVVTGISVDGARIWSGDKGKITSDPVYLGPGELASPQSQVALWQEPEGVVTYAYCH